MGELSRRVGEFEQVNPIESHEEHAKYLQNLEDMLRAAAIMFRQDGAIAGTWIRRRRPLTGAMSNLRERIAFGYRTKAHGRHGAKAFIRAADQVAKLAKLHDQFVQRETEERQAALDRAQREKAKSGR